MSLSIISISKNLNFIDIGLFPFFEEEETYSIELFQKPKPILHSRQARAFPFLPQIVGESDQSGRQVGIYDHS